MTNLQERLDKAVRDLTKPIIKEKIIAIDFDGTIVEQAFPEIGKLLPYAKEVLYNLYYQGYYIIIWTCRGGQELIDAKDFLDKKGIMYHKLNENAPFERVGFMPHPKIFADVYIDDRNLGGFPGWEYVEEMLSEGV